MATKEGRKFTPEFKREAVKLAEHPGRSLAAVARELGLVEKTLRNWANRLSVNESAPFLDKCLQSTRNHL